MDDANGGFPLQVILDVIEVWQNVTKATAGKQLSSYR